MGLIPSSLPCDLPDVPNACGQLFDMGERFIAVVLDALDDFVTDDCGCENLQGIVSLGEPIVQIGAGEMVAAHLVSWGPRMRNRPDNPSAARQSARFVAQWRIELWESCYPQIEGNTQPQPIPLGFLHEIHRHIYAHAHTAWRAMWNAWADPADEMYPHCDELAFGDLRPLPPQGTYAGFTWDVAGQIGYATPMEQP